MTFRVFATLTFLCYLILSVPQAWADDVTTTIDDSDPGIKHVVGQWVQFTGDEYYNKTETLTREAGATTMYTFTGTSISVFGTQCDPAGGNTTVSTYSVDGSTASRYTVPPNVQCNQNFVNFYSSPPLQNGQHTLVITNLNNGAWFFIDFLKVTAPKPEDPTPAPPPAASSDAPQPATSSDATSTPAVSTVASTQSSSGTPTSTSSTSSTSTSSATPTQTQSAPSTLATSSDASSTPPTSPVPDSAIQSSRPQKVSSGAIAGIALGAAVLLVVAIIFALWWTKRRRTIISRGPETFLEFGTETRAPPSETMTPYLVTASQSTVFEQNNGTGKAMYSSAAYPQYLDASTTDMSAVSNRPSEPQAEMAQVVHGSVVESESLGGSRFSMVSTILPAYER